jgi:hypothetical protein
MTSRRCDVDIPLVCAREQENTRKGERLRPQDDLSLGRREEVPSGEGRGCEGRGEDGGEGEWERG